MKAIFFSFLFLSQFALIAKESVQVGEIIGAGKFFKTKEFTCELIANDLSIELAEATGNKIRALVITSGRTCEITRYEISPFTTESNLPPWTLKQIPKYVHRRLPAFNPKVTPDGNQMFWTTLIEKKRNSTQKIWYSELDEFGFWKPGIQLAEPLNNDTPSAVISALPGGNELFVFGSYSEEEIIKNLEKEMDTEHKRIIKESKNEREYKLRFADLQIIFQRRLDRIYSRVPLYKTFKTGHNWTHPKPISFPDFYNLYKKEDNPNQQVFGGSALSSSGKVLIYSVMQSDSQGKLDLYISIADKNGNFPLGRNLGRTINTNEEEMAPFLAADDRTLYFSSNGHNGLSIYFTQRIGDGWINWTSPLEISKNLQGVNFFTIPASGNWAYISKNGQLYMTYLPQEFRPKPVILVKGKVKNEKGEPIDAEIIFESLKNNEQLGTTISESEKGNFSIVVPHGERYGFVAKKNGYLPVHKSIDLRNSDNLYKEVDVDIVLPEIKKGKEIVINNLFFDTKKFDITKDSEPELDRLAEIIKENKNIKISIEGHTDNVGGEKDNLELSKARANSVLEYLHNKHKIPKERLSSKGFGEKKPVADNSTPESRAKNRRVIFKILD
ncbi:MAG: OmpA family protein [Leptospiraceae bacterium]|nr:OmpA family protein [Leptospiraceae bacterium]NUM42513.1 OmpA family protein [Leptospiraceae bacterium]